MLHYTMKYDFGKGFTHQILAGLKVMAREKDYWIAKTQTPPFCKEVFVF